jgi:hypothetical protein
MASDKNLPDQVNLEELVMTWAVVLGLRLEPEWVPGVAQQLMITLGMVELLDAVELDDESQPASTYRL